MAKKYRLFGLALLVSLALDQATKIWARASLKPRWPPVKVIIADYFDLHYSENTGAAFSLLRDVAWARWLFLGFGAVALFILWRYVRRVDENKRLHLFALGLVTGGALGNLIDRVLYGRVTDFILWKVHHHRWPVFNIADAALLVGIVLLLLERPAPKGEAA
jgi:signal peptidase II